MNINTRVWRRFLAKVLKATLAVIAFIVYVLVLVLAALSFANYFNYNEELVLFVAAMSGIIVPFIIFILHGEFKLTQIEVKIEDSELMTALQKEYKND